MKLDETLLDADRLFLESLQNAKPEVREALAKLLGIDPSAIKVEREPRSNGGNSGG